MCIRDSPETAKERQETEKRIAGKQERRRFVLDKVESLRSLRKAYCKAHLKSPKDQDEEDEDMDEEQDDVVAAYTRQIDGLGEELVELKAFLEQHKPLQKRLVEGKSDLGKSKKQLLAAEARLQEAHAQQRAAAATILREQEVVAQLQGTFERAEARVEGIEEEMREAAEADGGSDGEEADEPDPDEEHSKAFDQWLELEGVGDLGKVPDCFVQELKLRLTRPKVPQPVAQEDAAPRRPGAFRRPSSKAAGAAPAAVAGKSVPAQAAAAPAPPPAAPDPASRALGLGPTPLQAAAEARGAPPAPPVAGTTDAGDQDVDLVGGDAEAENEAEGAPSGKKRNTAKQ